MNLAPRNARRVDMLAGCTPLAVELNFARISVTEALHRHRNAQRARNPHAARPPYTRQRVRDAILWVRALEAQVEAAYGNAVRVSAPFLQAAE